VVGQDSGALVCKITPIIGLRGRPWTTSKAILRDLYHDLTSGELPGIRKMGELVVS
jgi:hypothetical protein